MLIVQKYGGSSVADAGRIKMVARRVVAAADAGNKLVVVVSARGNTTDELIALARGVSDNPPPREMDMLLATGEQVSIALMAMAIADMGRDVISLTGPQAGVLTSGVHNKARILNVNRNRLKKELEQGRIVIVAGFQGITVADEITTLGRGGSDTTAVALAAALEAGLCQIFTDVDGVYTADPRVVPGARKLPVISYDEMLEMASLGALVLQPRSVELAKEYGICLEVRSSFNDHEGTVVQEVCPMEKDMLVRGVAHDLNVAKITIFDVPDRPGVARQLFSALAEASINVDMIVQSATRKDYNDISFTVSQEDMRQALAVTSGIGREIAAGDTVADADVAKVSIVGAGMISKPGVAAQMFGALAGEGVNMQMISTSEIKISCVIRAEDATRAVRSLHDYFGLGGCP